MDIIKWQPLTEPVALRRALKRLFDDTVVSEAWHNDLLGGIIPPLDMVEREKDIQVKVVVPGVVAEDLDIEITGNTLTVKGESRSEKEDKSEKYFHGEWQQGSFMSSLTLPEGTETGKADAELENGVLTITIPRSETASPKTVKVTEKKLEKTAKKPRKTEK